MSRARKTRGAEPSVVGNFLYSSLTTVLNVVVPLATYPYLARVLGPDNMGRLGVASSFANYFIVAAGLGFATYGVRAVAATRRDEAEQNRRVTELIVLAVVADIIAAASYFAVIAAVPRYRADIGLFAIFGLTVVAAPLAVDWVFRGVEEFRFIGVRNIVIQLAYVAALFAIVRSPENTLAYAGICAATVTAGAVVNLYAARRFVTPNFAGLRPLGHLGPMALFAAISFGITAYTNLDFLFLGLVSTAQDAGFYSIALRLVRMVTTVTATLSGVLLPRLSLLAGRDEEEFIRLVRRSASATLLFALPAAAGLAAVAQDLALLFGGADYAPAAASLAVLAPLVVVVAGSNFLQLQILIPRGRERALLVSILVGLAVTAIAMALLVRPLGHVGAAWGMLMGETAVFLTQALMCGRGELRAVIDRRALLSYGAGAILSGLVAWWVRGNLHTGLVPRLGLSVAAGVLTYGAVLCATRDQFVCALCLRFKARKGAP